MPNYAPVTYDICDTAWSTNRVPTKGHNSSGPTRMIPHLSLWLGPLGHVRHDSFVGSIALNHEPALWRNWIQYNTVIINDLNMTWIWLDTSGSGWQVEILWISSCRCPVLLQTLQSTCPAGRAASFVQWPSPWPGGLILRVLRYFIYTLVN